LGGLAYGHFADHCGRVAALVSSCFLALVGSLATSMSTDFFTFAISRFLVGASYDTCFTMVYILGKKVHIPCVPCDIFPLQSYLL